jgi:hypothetical protein
VPASARGRLGLLAVLVVFLIPIGISWLGGLTQIVTCDQVARSTLAVDVQRNSGGPIVLGSTSVARNSKPLCDRLVLSADTLVGRNGSLRLRLGLKNASAQTWRGTVRLKIGGQAPVDVAIGEIAAGKAASQVVPFSPPSGRTEIPLEVLVGP